MVVSSGGPTAGEAAVDDRSGAPPIDVGELARSLAHSDRLASCAAQTIAYAVEATGARWAELVAPRADGQLMILASRDADLTRELIRAGRESHPGPPLPSPTLGVDRIVIDDLDGDPTWPAFSALARSRTPVRSAVLQFLVVGGRYAAVLPVYHDEPGFFTPDRQQSISTLASIAGVALAGLAAAEEARQLSSALDSNRTIATAVGIVMATERVSRSAAYAMLRRKSQRTNRKLRSVAEEILQTGSTATLR